MAEDFNVRLRLPRTIQQGDIIEVKIKIKHPSLTGLALNDEAMRPFERFDRAQPAEFIRSVDLYYGEEQVSQILMNASTSNDPLLELMLRADHAAPVRVVVTNHQGETTEASEDIAFA